MEANKNQALVRINGYLHSHPESAQAMFVRAVILADQGQRTAAIQAFSEITEKYPSLPEPYNNLAVLYAELNRYDRAKEALETAIERAQGYPLLYENLGNIYLRLAAGAYDSAIQPNNVNATAWNKLLQIRNLLPAPKTVTDDKASTKISTDEADVRAAIALWVNAWSAKDWAKYQACYASSFTPDNGLSRVDWEHKRLQKISQAAVIQIQLSQLEVRLKGGNKAVASFLQSYREGDVAIRTRKTLTLQKINMDWLIEQELEGHGMQLTGARATIKD